ncbi:hypothetical protein SSX86_005534 [Deinandra increscens subsp. villosa]|uniref:Complex 1 LYR protein domain-containing protein n=1 Tax=Deinandra increscens subsp. villosa TaxID=3103831 RepID=A0AAP0DU54_9ASTR
MLRALRIYGEVLRLVRRLPADSRPYYAKYARENFVNYRELDDNDPAALDELFLRAYNHSLWVLKKVCLFSFVSLFILLFRSLFTNEKLFQYSVDQEAASKLREICGGV